MEINNDQMLHGLYGSKITRNRAVGYCYLHHTHLTVKMIKQHGCLNKCGNNCDCLKKHEHQWWDQQNRIKEIKKMKKDNMVS